MQKLLRLVGQNKNLVIIILSLMVLSMTTVLAFWDDSLKGQKASVTHLDPTISLLDNDVNITNVTNKQWQEVVQDVSEGQFIFVLTPELNFLHLDDLCLESFGYSDQEMKDHKFLEFIHPQDLTKISDAIIKSIKNKESVSNIGPYRFRVNTPLKATAAHQPNRYRLLISTIVPITDEENNIIQLVGIHKDITEEVGDSGFSFPDLDLPKETDNPDKIRNQEDESLRRIVVEKQ